MGQTLEVQEVRERLLNDTPYWARHCATILREDKTAVRPVPRPWQLSFDAALERQRAQGRPMRALVLKARKLGFSTWVQLKFVQRVTQRPFQYALVAAQDRKTAGVLMDMARLCYERLPTEEQLGLGFSIRPRVIGSGASRTGAQWMVLGDPRRSTEASIYETMTAGATTSGRGYTPSCVHGSEVAHWEDPGYLVGLLNAVPDIAETIIVLESTANGFNHFHDRWQRAVAGAEDPDTGGLYVPLFYGWQDNPLNSLEFPTLEARARFEVTVGDPEAGGDDEELWLLEEFDVTLEQLYWRRVTMSEKCEGKLELFHQEHPATAEQAFIGSGTPVFAGILISKAIKQAETAAAPVEGVLRADETRQRATRSGTVIVPQHVIWVPGDRVEEQDRATWGGQDRLSVWEHPLNEETQEQLADDKRRPDGQYVVFVDVAQGKGTAGKDRDFSAIQVVNHTTKMQVARFHSRIPVHDLPLVVFLVGAYYNWAWVAPEVTGLGIGLLDALVKDYRYPKVYRRKRAGDDQRQDQREQLLGWSTDMRTKPLMEQTFGQSLRDGSHGLRCVQTARQFTTYIEDERGHHAQAGAHDDLVMAYMGAIRVAFELRPRDPSKKAGRSVRGRTVEDDLTGY